MNKIILFLLFFNLLTCGCALQHHEITSEITKINKSTNDIVPIYLPLKYRAFPISSSFEKYFEIDNPNSQFYFDSVSIYKDPSIPFSVTSEMLIGIFSFVIPPLSFIKTPVNQSCKVSYSIVNRNNKNRTTNEINFSVKGYIQGWYIWRFNGWSELQKNLYSHIDYNSANLIISDISSNPEFYYTKLLFPKNIPMGYPNK